MVALWGKLGNGETQRKVGQATVVFSISSATLAALLTM